MTKYVRLDELDILRGWAIVLMIVFHIFYNLNYFHYIEIDMYKSIFWNSFRGVIVFIFLLCMGISLHLTHMHQINWKKVRQRLIVLGGASGLVSITTYMVFPDAWVYFGILHFALCASLLGLLFLPYPRFSLLISFLIFWVYIKGNINMYWLWEIINTYIITLPYETVDMVRFIPWFLVVLIGIVMSSYGYHKKLLDNPFFKISFKHNKELAFLGKHSLFIYLIHQPILFGFLMVLDT